MFSCRKVGLIDGGVEKMLWNWLLVKKNEVIVMVMMLIRIVFGIFSWFSIVISMKFSMVSIVGVLCRLFSVMQVVGEVVMMLVFFSVISVRNKLMLIVIVQCSDIGIVWMISVCRLNSEISRNRQFEMNIVFSVVCQVKFMCSIMMQVKYVFRFMLGVSVIGQFVYRFMIVVFSVVIRQVVMNMEFLGMLVLLRMEGFMKMMQVIVRNVVRFVISLVCIVVLCFCSLNMCLVQFIGFVFVVFLDVFYGFVWVVYCVGCFLFYYGFGWIGVDDLCVGWILVYVSMYSYYVQCFMIEGKFVELWVGFR